MSLSKKTKRRLAKTIIPVVSSLIALSLFLHVFNAPKIPKFKISFADEFVSIGLAESGIQIPNILIERDGIPGSMVFYDRVMIIAFLDSESYWRAKNTPTIWGEPNKDGVIIGVKPTYVTLGPYVAMPYELTGNKEHIPNSECKVFIIDTRDTLFFYRKSSNII